MNLPTVGMVSSYVNLRPSPSDWMWNQSPQPFGVWQQMQMQAPAARPDFLLLYQFDFPRPQPPQSWRSRLRQRLRAPAPPADPVTEFRGVPKERLIYLLREPPLPEVLPTARSNYAQAQQSCGYVSGPDDLAPVPGYMPAIWYVGASFRELNELPPPQKVKPCSWVTSGISRTASHRQRLDFLQQLQAHRLEFDLYGRGLPDWAVSSGPVGNKWNVMAPYYYNLAIENYADNDWYASEKLWDALLAWCLPIYYGGGAADKLLPPGSFLKLPSLDEKGLQYIQAVTATPDAWYEAQPAIAEARQIILHRLNLLNWLSDCVAQFS
ncbi:MAG: glycosyltransferase [Cyanobacteria bacterium Co-bin13]|nr:glycosyltransferase [Cyanobacteria bacterium Co-bin13]